MNTSLTGYRWEKTGERCCMTHRLVPVDNTASPCLAVVYERCPASHREQPPKCELPLSYQWAVFKGTRMVDGQFRKGWATSLEEAKSHVIGALAVRRAERRISETLAQSQ